MSNAIVKVKLRKTIDSGYGIEILPRGKGSLAKKIVSSRFGNSYCIITDSNVENIFGRKLLAQLRKCGAKAELISFHAGERNKNLRTVSGILEKMVAKGFDRKSCVIALGGGIAGDVAGFCASVYMRGIPFVQVPTTLLAMADSSVGGKTGVNLFGGKNSAGSFYQPKRVFACLDFLDSLPQREVLEGLSEAVKYGAVLDAKFFSFLEKNLKKAVSLDKKTTAFIVKRCCSLKAEVVAKDEKEGNYRKVLNFGHTIGHALEKIGDYKGLSHGEAIAIGMVCEAEISRELGLMKESEVQKTRELLHKIGLPVKIPKGKKYSSGAIVRASKSDKKNDSGKTFYSLPKGIGKPHSVKGKFGIMVKDSIVLKALGRCM